jgi:hypothetical protein
MSDTMRPASPVPRSASRTVMDSHGRTRGHVRPPWAAGRCPFDVGLRRASSGPSPAPEATRAAWLST